MKQMGGKMKLIHIDKFEDDTRGLGCLLFWCDSAKGLGVMLFNIVIFIGYQRGNK